MLVAASKNDALALLLEGHKGLWPPKRFFALGLCHADRRVCGNPRELAHRVRAAGNGSQTCEQAALGACRESHMLGDTWDDVLVLLARAANYETIFLFAPLVSRPDDSVCGVSEIADLRVPERAVRLNPTLADQGLPSSTGRPPLTEEVAEALATGAKLTMRDPLRLTDDRAARPCRLESPPRLMLACEGHVSTRLNDRGM